MNANKHIFYWSIASLGLGAIFLYGWKWHNITMQSTEKAIPTKHYFQNVLKNVRLGDGTLLGVETFVHWKVDSLELFYEQFDSLEQYATEILYPRQSEWCNKLTSKLDKRLFRKKSIQQKLKADLKNLLCQQMGEPFIKILEVEISNIYKQKTLKEIIAEFKQQGKTQQNTQPKSNPSSSSRHLAELKHMKSSTIIMLQQVEKQLNETLVINSGYRDKEHNRKVNGVSNSSHLRGYAVDIAIYSKKHRKQLVKALENTGFKRIGIYSTHVHADNDPSLPNARW